MKLESIIKKVKVGNEDFFCLDTPSNFKYTAEIIKILKENYDPKFEKGGLLCFNYKILNGVVQLITKEIIFVRNCSKTPNRVYSPHYEELFIAYENAFSKGLLPLAFHTHPTSYSSNDNIVDEGMNFLQQLNTSIADQGYTTRKHYTYQGVAIRFPDILIVENANALFIGMYGGLISPISFTKQKEKSQKDGIEKIIMKLDNWADTPERRNILLFSACAIVILSLKYPKVAVPLILVAGIVTPPILYTQEEIHTFLGVSYGKELSIHIPKIDVDEIVENEINANKAKEEALSRRKAKKDGVLL